MITALLVGDVAVTHARDQGQPAKLDSTVSTSASPEAFGAFVEA